MSYAHSSLSAGERVLNVFRLHWFSYVPAVAYTIFSLPFFALGIGPNGIGVCLFIGACFILAAAVKSLSLYCMEQALTTQRVILKRGIVTRKTEEMRLAAIETAEIEQSLFGRMFNYGDVKLTGRGVSVLTFCAIDTPIDVKRRIEEAITQQR